MLPGRPADHPLGLDPDRHDLAGVGVEGHDRRLVEHDPAPAHVHQGVRGAQIDGHVTAQETPARCSWGTRTFQMVLLSGVLYEATAAAYRAVRMRPCVLHGPGPGHLNEVGEEDLDFPLGRVWRVRSVHDVLLHFQRMIASDRARGGADRIGGTGQTAERLDGPRALGDQGDQRPGGDELDQGAEERLAGRAPRSASGRWPFRGSAGPWRRSAVPCARSGTGHPRSGPGELRPA